jgi:hypothetical protein
MRVAAFLAVTGACLSLAACGGDDEASAPAQAPAASDAGTDAAAIDPATLDPGAANVDAYAPELPSQVAQEGTTPSSGQAVNGYWPDGRPVSAWTAAEMPAGQLPPLPQG